MTGMFVRHPLLAVTLLLLALVAVLGAWPLIAAWVLFSLALYAWRRLRGRRVP